jgi:hypothetical protein
MIWLLGIKLYHKRGIYGLQLGYVAQRPSHIRRQSARLTVEDPRVL